LGKKWLHCFARRFKTVAQTNKGIGRAFAYRAQAAEFPNVPDQANPRIAGQFRFGLPKWNSSSMDCFGSLILERSLRSFCRPQASAGNGNGAIGTRAQIDRAWSCRNPFGRHATYSCYPMEEGEHETCRRDRLNTHYDLLIFLSPSNQLAGQQPPLSSVQNRRKS
jgi:hypothetical protein